ncbi:MAG: Gfo/Idh/MocA family oxidoreductase [Deinococcales bacterium]
MKVLNIAMIGAGRMGQTHANVLKTLLEVKITHVVDFLPENAAKAAELLGAKVAEEDEVLKNPDVDAVFITTPTPAHAESIVKAARAGKAIFVEKPLASTLEASYRVVETIEQTGVPCQVGFMRRYDPAYLEVKKRIDSGEMGKVENFRAISRDPYQPKLEYLKTSGGILVDMGIHDFDSARYFCGEVEEVYAIGTAVRDERLKDFNLFNLAVATIRFKNGAVGTVENALNTSYGYEIVADILGEKGKYHLQKKQQLNFEFWGSHGVSHDYPQYFDQRFPEAYANEVISFAKNVLGGKPVGPTAQDALESSRLALAAQHSLETGNIIHVPSFA